MPALTSANGRASQAGGEPNEWLDAAPRPQVMGATSELAQGFCTRNCGRRHAPGLDRRGQPYATCCRSCALGAGHHDACGGGPKELSGDVEFAMMLQLEELAEAQRASEERAQQLDAEEQREQPRDWPRTLSDPVWGEYTVHEGKRVHPLVKAQCFNCCPCCLIGCSDRSSQRAWRNFLVSWSFTTGMVQIALMVLSTVLFGGFVSMDKNPMLGPHYHALDLMGAKNAVRILEKGEWYRLFCPMFLHGGWFHLTGNLLVQLRVGVMLEVMWGSSIWILIFVPSGLYSSLASCIYSPEHLGIGSSGALCGLLGAWLTFNLITWNQTLPMDVRERNMQTLNVGTSVLLIIGLSFLPLMDAAAHFGGLAMGIALAMVVFASRLQHQYWRMGTRICGYVLLLALVPTTLWWFLNNTHPSQNNLNLCDPRSC